MRAGKRFWLLYAAVWALFAIIYAVLLSAEYGGRWGLAALGAVMSASLAALLGVAVWWLSGRLEYPRTKPWVFFVTHLTLASLYSLIFNLSIYLRIAVRVNWNFALELMRRDAFGWQLFSGLWLYGVLAAVFYFIRSEQRAREQQDAFIRVEASRARAEALQADAELRALRAQLNPHFIFNALHTVAALVRRDPAKAEDAIERLGGLLRYVLNHEGEEREDVTLAQELAFVRDYLMLEQLRVGDRLRVIESIDPQTESCSIPALTLQPLVENAVRHAVAPRIDTTTITMSALKHEQRLQITVKDDGPGAQQLKSGGVGLQAVRQRLLIRFNGDARLDTRNGNGFVVSIDVPYTCTL